MRVDCDFEATGEATAAVAGDTIGLPVAESFDPGQPDRVLMSPLRTSRSSFIAFAGWYPNRAGGRADLCSLELLASGSDASGVTVEIGRRLCYVG